MRSRTSCFLASLLFAIPTVSARAELIGTLEVHLGEEFEPAQMGDFDGTAYLNSCVRPWNDSDCVFGSPLFNFAGTIVSAADVGVPIVVDPENPAFAAYTGEIRNGRLSTICIQMTLRPALWGTGLLCHAESSQLFVGPAALHGYVDWQGFDIHELHLTLLSFELTPYFDPFDGFWGVRFQSVVRLDVHGAALEPGICQNGMDDDGDGFADLADPGCADPEDASENVGGIECDDGGDNDSDGLSDAAEDPGCTGPTDESEWEATLACDDGQDNDDDGLYDSGEDPGCKDAWFPIEDPQCQDGIDNDGRLGVDFDGGVSATGVELDLRDRDCNVPWKNKESSPVCGLGFEMALLVTPLLALRARRRARSRNGMGTRG